MFWHYITLIIHQLAFVTLSTYLGSLAQKKDYVTREINTAYLSSLIYRLKVPVQEFFRHVNICFHHCALEVGPLSAYEEIVDM